MHPTNEAKFLEGSRVYLRPLNMEDAEMYYHTLYQPETRRLTGTQQHFTKHQIEQYIANKSTDSSSVLLLIALQENDEVIGDIAIQDIHEMNRSANLRIAITHSQHQGRGLGQEAILLMLDYGFGIRHLHRIELEVFAYNPRAQHVYEKIGFVQEGIRRQGLFYDHQYHDVILMSMLTAEYRAKYC
ncbi:GNAT family N-acetyltransferase [Paenibacillus selenitireducens]|uniref:GNAT family N-acetyltransferase n=1 Tax=Paenibacillus selenitireducens TaxID=1324314 RepID=A0A1T2X1K5_9BACL|nr:GNAT family protein [Paenibacillus selenitireducens]OPA73750.1 GNAT family N-acetyltransferase [Paenibacillus selenitireducens]